MAAAGVSAGVADVVPIFQMTMEDKSTTIVTPTEKKKDTKPHKKFKTMKFTELVKKIICINRIYKLKRQQLLELRKNFRVNTQKYFAIDYMLTQPFGFVNQGELLHYCDKRRNETTNGKHKCYRDNSRGIESLRKDKFPLRWIETTINGNLYFKYVPEKKLWNTEEIIKTSHRKSGLQKI